MPARHFPDPNARGLKCVEARPQTIEYLPGRNRVFPHGVQVQKWKHNGGSRRQNSFIHDRGEALGSNVPDKCADSGQTQDRQRSSQHSITTNPPARPHGEARWLPADWAISEPILQVIGKFARALITIGGFAVVKSVAEDFQIPTDMGGGSPRFRGAVLGGLLYFNESILAYKRGP